MIPCNFMTSELRRSALIVTIDLIENSRNTRKFMTTYVEMDVKIQKSQTKAITNHTGTTNY